LMHQLRTILEEYAAMISWHPPNLKKYILF
jgi:hypothetical protein